MLFKLIRQILFCSAFGLFYASTAWGADTASPAMLSNTCLGCHGPGGISSGPATPTISGMSEIYIIAAMLAYKYDNDEDKVEAVIEADPDLVEDVEFFARASTVMNRIAKGYSDAEIKIIAKHFSELPFKAQGQDTDAKQVKAGAKLHEKHCEKCHEDAGRLAEDDAGVLAGQWAPYLEYTMADYSSGDRAMPKKMKKQMQEVQDAHGGKGMDQLIQFYANQK